MRPGARAVIVQAATLIALGSTLFLVGCAEFFTPVNNNPNPGTTNTYVYVTNVSSSGSGGTLTAYSLNNGVLASLTGSPYALVGAPSSLVVAPNNAFLYVGTNTGIFVYTIASDGTLSLGNNSAVVFLNQTNPTVQSMAMDSTSSWLIITSQGSSELDALPIDPTTGLPSSSSPVAISLGATTPQQVTISPAGDNVFVAMGSGGAKAVAFTASSNNPWGSKLVNIPIIKANGLDNSVAVDTTSAYIFLGEVNSNLLRMLPIADLTKEVDVATGVGPSAILPDKTGTYVYVTNATDATISGYTLSIGPNPGLAALTDGPYATSQSPIGIVEDSSKTYLLTAGSAKSPNLWMFNFDSITPGDLNVKTTTSTGTSPSLSDAIGITH